MTDFCTLFSHKQVLADRQAKEREHYVEARKARLSALFNRQAPLKSSIPPQASTITARQLFSNSSLSDRNSSSHSKSSSNSSTGAIFTPTRTSFNFIASSSHSSSTRQQQSQSDLIPQIQRILQLTPIKRPVNSHTSDAVKSIHPFSPSVSATTATEGKRDNRVQSNPSLPSTPVVSYPTAYTIRIPLPLQGLIRDLRRVISQLLLAIQHWNVIDRNITVDNITTELTQVSTLIIQSDHCASLSAYRVNAILEILLHISSKNLISSHLSTLLYRSSTAVRIR
jgi:hypothetical protein